MLYQFSPVYHTHFCAILHFTRIYFHFALFQINTFLVFMSNFVMFSQILIKISILFSAGFFSGFNRILTRNSGKKTLKFFGSPEKVKNGKSTNILIHYQSDQSEKYFGWAAMVFWKSSINRPRWLRQNFWISTSAGIPSRR